MRKRSIDNWHMQLQGRGRWSTGHNQSNANIPVGRRSSASDSARGRQCVSVRWRSDDGQQCQRVMPSCCRRCSWRGSPGVEHTPSARPLLTTYSVPTHRGLLRAGKGFDLQRTRADTALYHGLTASSVLGLTKLLREWLIALRWS